MTERLIFREMNDAMIVFEFLKAPEILDALKQKGLTVDWKALFDYIAVGVVVDMDLNDKKRYVRSLSDEELNKLANSNGTNTLNTPTNGTFTIYGTTIRQDIDALREYEAHVGSTRTCVDKIIGILDRLEREMPKYLPFVSGTTVVPGNPPYIPPQMFYVGDPPGGGIGGICGNQGRPQASNAVADATGTSETGSDVQTADDIPF